MFQLKSLTVWFILCLFWIRWVFLQWICVTSYVIWFRAKCGLFIILLPIYIALLTFLLWLCISLSNFLNYSSVWFTCSFLFLMWLSLQMLCPDIEPFCFQGCGLLRQKEDIHSSPQITRDGWKNSLSFYNTWFISIHTIHVALHKLQAVVLMLHTVTFHVCGKTVSWNSDKITSNGCPFLSILSFLPLNVADKHGITVIPVYISTHHSVEADYILFGNLIPEWNLLSYIS